MDSPTVLAGPQLHGRIGLTADAIAAMSPAQIVAHAATIHRGNSALNDPATLLCPVCGGQKWVAKLGGGSAWCPECDGCGWACSTPHAPAHLTCIRCHGNRRICPAMVCAVCHGSGWVADRTAATKVVGVPCPACESGRTRWRDAISAAGIPDAYRTYSFDAFLGAFSVSEEQSVAAGEAFALAKDPDAFCLRTSRRGLLLTGPTGVGKTGLAVSAALELVGARGARLKFVNWRALLAQLRATFDKESPVTELDVLLAYTDAEVLVLDDLGASGASGSDWRSDVAYRITELRSQQRGGLTVVTTNLDAAGVSAEFGPAVQSRLWGLCHVVPMTGDDLRLVMPLVAQGIGDPVMAGGAS